MTTLSNVKKAWTRDKAILDTLQICGAMNVEQLTELFFKFPSGKRKCQDRVKSLFDKGLVKRVRLSLDTSTLYYVNKFPGLPEHSLAVSWCYIWFMKKQGEKVLTWEIEQLKEFGLKCDALCSTKIMMTGEIRWYCIEFERSSSRNKFKKISNYDELYKKEGYAGSRLMERLDNPSRFPKVIIVTDSIKKGQKIKELINNSVTKVKYELHLLNEIMGLKT